MLATGRLIDPDTLPTPDQAPVKQSVNNPTYVAPIERPNPITVPWNPVTPPTAPTTIAPGGNYNPVTPPVRIPVSPVIIAPPSDSSVSTNPANNGNTNGQSSFTAAMFEPGGTYYGQIQSIVDSAVNSMGSSFTAGQLDNTITLKLQQLGLPANLISAAQQGEQASEPHGAGFEESNIKGGNTSGFESSWLTNITQSIQTALNITPPTSTTSTGSPGVTGGVLPLPPPTPLPLPTSTPPPTTTGPSGSNNPSGSPSSTSPTQTNSSVPNTNGGSITSDLGNLLSGANAAQAGVPGSGSIAGDIPTVQSGTSTSSGPDNTVAIIAIIAALALIGFWAYTHFKKKKAAEGGSSGGVST